MKASINFPRNRKGIRIQSKNLLYLIPNNLYLKERKRLKINMTKC